MTIFLRMLFVSVYAMAGSFLVIQLLMVAGLPLNLFTEIFLCSAWLTACFTANLWLPGFYLATQRVRKTIIEEEEWLHPIMHELALRTDTENKLRLLIVEQAEPNVFAIGSRTIVISRGMLVVMNENEIKAVIAHEYGHLRDHDTLTNTAFLMADKILVLLYRFAKWPLLFFRKNIWKGSQLPIKLFMAAVFTTTIFIYPEIILRLIIVILFVAGFPFVHSIVSIAWCYFTRAHEFRQDRFAHLLGFGRHLKSALLKIDQLDSGNMVSRLTELGLSHPLLYRRIRKLEWLEGMRAVP